ncbi:MAG: YgiT-type zinc finger protein [Anaerolineaceae bacterium]
MINNLPANPETCPRCMVGRIKQKEVTLSAIVDGKLLSVPNFPAWVCDVCHAFMYDPAAITELHTFLSSAQSAKPSRRVRPVAVAIHPIDQPIKKTR